MRDVEAAQARQQQPTGDRSLRDGAAAQVELAQSRRGPAAYAAAKSDVGRIAHERAAAQAERDERGCKRAEQRGEARVTQRAAAAQAQRSQGGQAGQDERVAATRLRERWYQLPWSSPSALEEQRAQRCSRIASEPSPASKKAVTVALCECRLLVCRVPSI